MFYRIDLLVSTKFLVDRLSVLGDNACDQLDTRDIPSRKERLISELLL